MSLLNQIEIFLASYLENYMRQDLDIWYMYIDCRRFKRFGKFLNIYLSYNPLQILSILYTKKWLAISLKTYLALIFDILIEDEVYISCLTFGQIPRILTKLRPFYLYLKHCSTDLYADVSTVHASGKSKNETAI